MAARIQLTYFCIGLGLLLGPTIAVDVNPIEKVLQLMDDLAAKITAEGAAEDKAYAEYVEWCDDTKTETGFEIKTATKEIGELEAVIGKTGSDISAATTDIEKLAESISTDEAELNAATDIRKKEAADFAATESELVDTVSSLDRAIALISKAMSGSALIQQQVNTTDMQGLLLTLNTVVDNAGLETNDKHKLLALVQDGHTDDEEDSELGAPAGAAYESQGGNIVDVLDDLKEKAEEQLSEARKAESNAQHNFNMMKQSIEDQLAADGKELSKTKSFKASSEEEKAGAESDLSVTTKDLAGSKKKLEMVTSDCAQMAEAHEVSIKGRAEELKAIATARKIVAESTGGAAEHQYSLLQVQARSGMKTSTDLRQNEIVAIVKRLAKKQRSAALAQLASRIAATVRYGAATGDDPFGKIKGLISDMIATLEKEAAEEASKKAYCDEEMGKSNDKKAELTSDVESLTAKIDDSIAKSTQLKEQVAVLGKELAAIAKTQVEMDKARQDEHAAFVKAEADLKQGIEGVQKALEVLREYYGSGAALIQQPAMPKMHSKAGGAGGSIISMLEVCLSDFTKSLTEKTVAEDEAATGYEKLTQENKVSQTEKEQGVKYKTAEAKSLDKAVSDATTDRAGLQTELDAVLEYLAKLTKECTYAPDSYETRKARREAELAGLKEALKYLEGAALLQKRSRRHSTRFLH